MSSRSCFLSSVFFFFFFYVFVFFFFLCGKSGHTLHFFFFWSFSTFFVLLDFQSVFLGLFRVQGCVCVCVFFVLAFLFFAVHWGVCVTLVRPTLSRNVRNACFNLLIVVCKFILRGVAVLRIVFFSSPPFRFFLLLLDLNFFIFGLVSCFGVRFFFVVNNHYESCIFCLPFFYCCPFFISIFLVFLPLFRFPSP